MTRYLEFLRGEPAVNPGRWMICLLFHRDQDPALAEAVATEAIERGCGVEFIRARAALRTALKRHAAALADRDELVRRQPDSAVNHIERAKVRATVDDHLGALADFNQALLLVKGDAGKTALVLSERSSFREGVGDLVGALEDAREARRLLPGKVDPERVRALEARLGARR